MAEEFGLGQRLGNRRAVERYQRRVGTPRKAVEFTSDQLLSCPGLPMHQDRNVRRRDTGQHGQGLRQRIVLRDDGDTRRLALSSSSETLPLSDGVVRLRSPPDESHQSLSEDGLFQEVVRTQLHGPRRRRHRALPAQEDHLRSVGIPLDRLEHLESVERGQTQVEDGHVEDFLAKRPESFAAVRHLRDVGRSPIGFSQDRLVQ